MAVYRKILFRYVYELCNINSCIFSNILRKSTSAFQWIPDLKKLKILWLYKNLINIKNILNVSHKYFLTAASKPV